MFHYIFFPTLINFILKRTEQSQIIFRLCNFLSINTYLQSYPEKEILYSIQYNDVTLITAETGSGKTTQIPQFLVQAGYTLSNHKIAVVLPRKIAALSIAKRISSEMGLHNSQIAHHVRFNSTVNQKTRVTLMTDGILVQKLYSDPLLDEFSVIVLDDIHQRSINYEILFGFLKIILLKRKDLKVVITSATIEDKSIRAFFGKKQIHHFTSNARQISFKQINVTGRLYAVNIHYLKEPTKNYFLKTFQTIIYIDRQTRSNANVLVFLTSVQQIQGMMSMLDSYQYQNKRKLSVMALHANLSAEEQQKIFESSFDRKVILSTNIAQSSITIPDIEFVIDCGYVKCKVFDESTGAQKMIVVPCGKSSCAQRAGRAGRVSNGYCYRIFTEKAYQQMSSRLPAEILRIDLSNFILKLKGLGIKEFQTFQFIESPPQRSLVKSIETLYAYELIQQDFQLTEKGKRVAELSLDFKNACMLMNSFDSKFGCSKEILMLVSMLQVQRDLFSSRGISVIKSKKKSGAKQGDFLTLINIFLRFFNAKHYEKKKVCGQMKVRHNTMEHAVKIYHELENQVKIFNRFASEAELMKFKYDAENEGQKKKIYEIKSSADVHETILRCILSGYFLNVAQIQGDGSYMSIRSSDRLQIHASSVVSVTFPEWIVFHQIVKTSQGFFIHNASQIYPEWIFELAGHYYRDTRMQKATKNYNQQLEIERPVFVPPSSLSENVGKSVGLVKVGGERKKPQMFQTDVLGLKNKKLKNTKLSFQDDLI